MTQPAGDLVVPAGRGIPQGLVIPADELVERFSRSSGPGGQSVNTTDSRVELLWDVTSSRVLSEQQRAQLLGVLPPTVSITASEQRSQWSNRRAARERLVRLIRDAMMPAVVRRATRPSRAAKQRRLDAKRHQALTKANRRRPD